MSSTPQSRPGQATLAVGLIVGGSLLAIVTAWERIAGLHSLEVQESLARLAADQPLGSMSVSTISSVLRVLSIIGAAAAAAAAILAAQVPRRSRSARIVLTCLAPLLFLGWLGTSGLFEPLVLAGIAMLWLPPTADWYAGRDPAVRASRAASGQRSARPDPFATPPAPPAQQSAPPTPRPPAGPQAQWPPPTEAAPHVPQRQPWASAAYAPPAPRPRSLVAACVITWICSALTVVGLIGAMVWLTTSGDAFVADILDRGKEMWGSLADGVTATQIRAELYVVLVGFLLWCLVAMALAVAAYHGRSWARILLAVSGIAAAICALLGSGAFPPLLVVVVGSVVATVQLLRSDSARWRPPR